ncbi:hypothetical protein [Wolbachia endosymbiont of Ceratitis capitata]|nr:hypothetical protein [Wolbachia endosymbiont of Ceratitis capitata]
MTGEGTAVIKEPVSATWMIPFFYLVWVMQEVYYNQALNVRK